MKKLHIIAAAMVAIFVTSCGGSATADYADGDYADTLTHHSRLLTLSDRGGGVVFADIADPWKDGRIMASYALVHRDSTVDAELLSGRTVIEVPVRRAAVFSSIHTAAMDELGVIDALAATADAAYLPPSDTVAALVATGNVADAGNSQSPSAEVLAAAQASVVLRSPMQGGGALRLPQHMTVVECADYMETGPIARAEWILLLGELFDRRDSARAIFTRVIDNYNDLMLKAAGASSRRPTVLVETETSGVWYVPAGGSYMAGMLKDAGADYPWADTEGSGSLALNLEAVAAAALDADMWLVRSFGYETTPQSLKAMNPRYAEFKAVKEGEIYSCNSAERLIFNDVAFHPERVLADYVAIFHPELLPDYKLRYFKRTGK